MSMHAFGMPFGFFQGQLPINVNLEVRGIFFSEVATALKVMAFDMQLAVATSYNPDAAPTAATGISTNAWGLVRDYDLDNDTTQSKRYSASDVYVVAKAAVAALARGDVIVMGEVTAAPKVGSAAHIAGQQLTASMATVGTLAPLAASATTLAATATTRKVIALCTNAATAATANVHFNGFGWGVVFKNVAYNAD